MSTIHKHSPVCSVAVSLRCHNSLSGDPHSISFVFFHTTILYITECVLVMVFYRLMKTMDEASPITDTHACHSRETRNLKVSESFSRYGRVDILASLLPRVPRKITYRPEVY